MSADDEPEAQIFINGIRLTDPQSATIRTACNDFLIALNDIGYVAMLGHAGKNYKHQLQEIFKYLHRHAPDCPTYSQQARLFVHRSERSNIEYGVVIDVTRGNPYSGFCWRAKVYSSRFHDYLFETKEYINVD